MGDGDGSDSRSFALSTTLCDLTPPPSQVDRMFVRENLFLPNFGIITQIYLDVSMALIRMLS